MEILLPYANFAKTAKSLDLTTLNEQRYVAFDILGILMQQTQTELPGVEMWRGYEIALLDHALTLCSVYQVRTLVLRGPITKLIALDDIHLRLLGLVSFYGPCCSVVQPPWLGIEALHSNHRRRLAEIGQHLNSWITDEPEAPGTLWPVIGNMKWVYVDDDGDMLVMKETPTRQLRPYDMAQCAYCNFWFNPEELVDANSHSGTLPLVWECHTCQHLKDQRDTVYQLRHAGDEECIQAAAELQQCIDEEIRLTRLGLV